MKYSVLKLVLMIMLCSSESIASEYFSLSGFANITPIHAGTPELGFRYDLATKGIFDEWTYKTASNIGLQVNGKITNEFEWVTQAVVADRLNNSVNKSLTLGFFATTLRQT